MTDKPRKKLLISTGNPGKFCEIKDALAETGYEIVSIRDLELNEDFVEIGDSHQEIAYMKAKYFYDQCKITTLADDSGIIVDALKTELGVRTRRWGAGHDASDKEWIDYFLKVMKDVPDAQRTARFICCVCLIDENESHIFVGETEGVILRELEAPIAPGLPLSSVFRPAGYDKVYSAMSLEDKNKISHRAKAMASVREYLKKL
jgi:XTP/dITP diphosphohydrolase